MPKQESNPKETETAEIENIKAEIDNLKNEDPKIVEGLIRELHKNISTITKGVEKENLLFHLKRVSCKGLGPELKKMVEENGLAMEALHLVLKYLTTKNELAQYIFNNPLTADKKDPLDNVKRRLGPKLEVLGGLCAKGIDVSKDWVQKLTSAAPSLQSLSRLSVGDLEEYTKDATHGEKKVVDRMMKIAESHTSEIAASQDAKQIGDKTKAIDEEKLEKAKALMNEAKEMAKKESEEAKKAVNEKMEKVRKILNLPPDWNKQDVGEKPEQLFGQLDSIIEQLNNVVEVGEAYKSDLEVVRKASGGRALCGIYYSEFAPAKTAELPIIIMPNEVILTSPNNSQQVRYMKFSKSRAAADYVEAVKSSSSNIGISVGRFAKLFVGNVSGSYDSSSEIETTKSEKMKTSSASVVQYIWIATKTFKIQQELLKLTASARKMALKVVKDEESARQFMRRYGSHYPAGLNTLGGVLFRIVDAESKSTKETSTLTESAAQQLQGQISVGFLGGMFGTGASVTGEKSGSSGERGGHEEQADDVSYTFSSQAMGPSTTNPATFGKLLANNSTWALIDRGSHNAYLPLWELVRDIGGNFEEAANILEKTWRDDEAEIKKKHDKEIRDGRDKIRLDGNTFLIINKKYDNARLAMWGTDHSRAMGTYEKEIFPDQFWQLKSDENHPGYFYIENVRRSGYRVAKWGEKNEYVGSYGGVYYNDQLWKFENVDGDYYRIYNFKYNDARITKWGKENSDWGTFVGPSGDNQIWKLVPRFKADISNIILRACDNREGSEDISEEITVTTGLQLVSSSSISGKVGLLESLEASLPDVDDFKTKISAQIKKSLSNPDEQNWSHQSKVTFTAPRGKNYRVKQLTCIFISPLSNNNCNLMCDVIVEETRGNFPN